MSAQPATCKQHYSSFVGTPSRMPGQDGSSGPRTGQGHAVIPTETLVDASARLARLHQTEHNPEAALWAIRQGFRASGDSEHELVRVVPAYDTDQDAVLAPLRKLRSRIPK